MTMKKIFAVLGAFDPEMQEIQRVLTDAGVPWAPARIRASRVKAHQAYDADRLHAQIPAGHAILSVECAVRGLPADVQVDHHHPGDAGYGKGPEDYLAGSSLGQVLQLLGVEPTKRHRYVAAADHCLSAAYAGACPGIDPEELRVFRKECKAEMRGIDPAEWDRQVEQAKRAILSAQHVYIGTDKVAWFDETAGDHVVPELSEASAQLGLPFVTVRSARADARAKAGIYSAKPAVVTRWMDICGLKDIYGDPARGFAGGYF